jgi:hypothetical protein
MIVKRMAGSVGVGLVVTTAVLIAIVVTQDKGESPLILKVLFWPASFFAWLFGPGPNLGDDANPKYEVTPVHLFLTGAAIFWTVAMYSVLTYAILTFVHWRRRSRGQERPDHV